MKPLALLLLTVGVGWANNQAFTCSSVPCTNILAVQAGGTNGSAVAMLLWSGHPIPVADTLVGACTTTNGAATLNISDSIGNTWVSLGSIHWNTSGSPTQTSQIWWVQSNKTQSVSDNITCGTTAGTATALAWEFTSPTGLISLDVQTAFAENDGGGNAGGNTVTVTPTKINDLLFSYWEDNHTCVATGAGGTAGSDISPININTTPLSLASGDATTGANSLMTANCFTASNFIVTALAFREGTSAPTITTTCPVPSGILNQAYSQTLLSNDSTATWSLSAGSLPSGISIFSNGALGGTPTASGTFPFTMKATNPSGGTNSTLSCSITIAGNAGTVGNGVTSGGVISGMRPQ